MMRSNEHDKSNRTRLRLLWSLVVPIIVPATASAALCVFEPIPTQDFLPPYKFDPVVIERVRGAMIDTPFTIEVRANQSLWLRFERPLPPTALDLRERLTVSRSRDGGTHFEAFCETPWIPAAQLSSFAQLKLDSVGPTIWRAQVHEENRTPTMTVLDEERPTLSFRGTLQGKPKLSPPPIPYFDQVRAEAPGVPAPCDITEVASNSDAIPVTAASIAEGGLQIQGTIYALSGRTLRLKIDRARAGPTVKILMSAKPVGYGIAARPVCTIEVAPGTLTQSEWITATAPWAMITEFQWRITLNSDGKSPAFNYAVFRERRHSMAAKDLRPHNTAAYSCTNIDIPKQAPVNYLRAAMFQSAYALTIRTNLQSEGVTGNAYRSIIDALLTSIDSWRLICTSCSPYQFSVIAIDGQVYVPAGMLQGVPENYRATFIFGYPWIWRISQQKNSGLFSSALSFTAVSNSARQRQRFCLQNDEDEYRFSAKESPLCRPSPPSSEQEMVVNLKWRPQGLSCDNRPNVVACWNGTDQIELNLKEYSFYVGDTGNVLFGKAGKGADLIRVFTHEVGHWLGLDHLAGDGNIMSDKLASARCIDDLDMRTINALAHGDIRRRHMPEALRYE
jgi:hypothetical protein